MTFSFNLLKKKIEKIYFCSQTIEKKNRNKNKLEGLNFFYLIEILQNFKAYNKD